MIELPFPAGEGMIIITYGDGPFMSLFSLLGTNIATQAGRLGFGQRPPTQAEQQNPVDQAREAVDAINGRMAQTYEAP